MNQFVTVLLAGAFAITSTGAVAQTGTTPAPASEKSKPNLNTPEAQKAMQKAANPQASSTPSPTTSEAEKKTAKPATAKQKAERVTEMQKRSASSAKPGSTAAGVPPKADPASRTAKPDMKDPKTQEALQKASKP